MASVSKRTWTHKGQESSAWIVRWTNRDDTQGSKQFKKKKDADAYCLKVENDLAAGTHAGQATSTTLAEVAEDYIRQREQLVDEGSVGRGSVKNTASVIRNHVVKHFGNRTKINDLNWSDLERFRTAMIDAKVGAPTRRNALRALRLIELYARKRDIVRKTFIGDFLAEAGRAPPQNKVRTFLTDQIAHLLRVVHGHQNGVRARTQLLRRVTINLAACCSLRYGEIMGLSVEDIDFEGRTVKVRHSLTSFDVLKSTKTRAGIRDVFLPAHVAEYLREWILSYYVANERKLLFRTPSGLQYHASTYHATVWRPALRRAGLLTKDGDEFHFHALRHFTSSLMIDRGFSPTAVAAQMGHSSFDMTLQVYAHPIVASVSRDGRYDRLLDDIAPVQLPVS